MRPSALALLLAFALASPAAAAPGPEAWGFEKSSEWPLGTGETSLGVRPADPNDPPNAEHLHGDGPMLASPGRLLDPVNGRQTDLATRKTSPYSLEKETRSGADAYRSLPGGELVVHPLRPTVFTGETLEARLAGTLATGDVVGVTRFADGEARTLYLHVDPFGAVRDLFELPVLPWPRRIAFDEGRAAFLLFRDPSGKRRACTPYEDSGVIELHESGNFTARLVERATPPAEHIPLALLPNMRVEREETERLHDAAYDPVADAFALFDGDRVFIGKNPLVAPELSAALSAMGQARTACHGDDGRFHAFDCAGSAGVTFSVSPEGRMDEFRPWRLALPPGPPRSLANLRVTRTGEIFLDDLASGRTLRFLPDGSLLGEKEGLVGASVTERGLFAVSAGEEPSSRPLLEFDLALNFQRKLADLVEPGGRVGTVRILGLDDRHRLHAVRFRGGFIYQTVFDQETGKLLAERPVSFSPHPSARPVGNGFFLRHDGALRILRTERKGAVLRTDYPAF